MKGKSNSYLNINDKLIRDSRFANIPYRNTEYFVLMYCISTLQPTMSPLDVVVLLKIISLGSQSWNQKPLAESLFMSQSEISKSVARSRYAGLLDPSGKNVRKLAFIDFLKYGIAVVFPQQPGAVVRGVPTAHSAPPLSQTIQSTEHYVWPSGKGTLRGQSIVPLYPSVVDAVQNDQKLHELLAMVDAIRIGRAREKELAIN